MKLVHILVISIFLYACESWTAELEKRTHAFVMKCYRRQLNISNKGPVTSEEVCRNIKAAIGKYDELLTLVKKRKLRQFLKVFWFSKDNPTGHSERKTEEEADRRRGGKTILKSGRDGLCQLN